MTGSSLIPYAFAKRHHVLVTEVDGELTVLYCDVLPLQVYSELQRQLNRPFVSQKIEPASFKKHLGQIYEVNSQNAMAMLSDVEDQIAIDDLMESMPTTQDLLDSQDDAPIIRLLNALFAEAIKRLASDIHIESYADSVLVRFRIDGVLQSVLQLSRGLGPLIISRIKVMAKLDIAEKRLPQDGHIQLNIAGHYVDIRVSTLPSSHAERVVMRVLDKNVGQLRLDLLGMNSRDLKHLRSLSQRPHGIILVTGPTGSGKTTTLYAMLTELNEVSRNILTVEDPIEYDLPGIGQTQVNNKVAMTFARGLRAILRQDPDIIMIGEIRDLETAEIAVQASLTGHLVLSTLHTNTAIGAITRLRDMGVQPFLLSSSLAGVIAQRLLRKLCEHCKQEHQADSEELALLGQAPGSSTIIYQAVGCDKCQNLGYQGRTGIYEIITINDEIKQLLHQECDEATLISAARKQSPSITSAGQELVRNGTTSLAEYMRVTVNET